MAKDLNYVNPGVYVRQIDSPALSTISTAPINICIISDDAVPTSATSESFIVQPTPTTGQEVTLLQSTVEGVTVDDNSVVIYSLDPANVVAPEIDSSLYTVASGVITFDTSQTFGGYTYFAPNTSFKVEYDYTLVSTETVYTFSTFNAVQQVFGPAFTFNGSTATLNSKATLAAWLAYQNGAQVVSILLTTGSLSQNWIDSLTVLTDNPEVDVIVPLYYDVSYEGAGPYTGFFKALFNFLTIQQPASSNGAVYQRAFLGLATDATNTLTTVQNIINDISTSRISLAIPQAMKLNPGLSSVQAVTTGPVEVDGFYLAAALAGLFAGQPDVYMPITHKNVNGFTSVPNQMSIADSNTYQSWGTVVVRQRRDGTIYVRHGLTTDMTSWVTKEISISAIGDRLANRIRTALENSSIIGGVMTPNTLGALQTIVAGTLIQAQTENLIQSYQNLTYTVVPPTAVSVTFQYAPTYPLNYIDVNFSLNAQTGQLQFVTTPNNTTTY